MENTNIMPRPKTKRAWAIARGEAPAPQESCGQIWGAKNSYNARGRGNTYVRRVYRDGRWQWFSPPASRGRFLAADRKDTKYGDVYIGDIIAEYTLGSRTPDQWLLIVDGDGEWATWVSLDATKLRNGRWRVTVASSPGKEDVPGELDVPDPYWR
jgi:hypothetical protein